MKKSLYLKLSQQETNKKNQLSLVEQYRRIRQKSNLLGWLYFIVAYVSFSSVAIVSFIYRWIMISKDFRFTPHYLQTVIDYNKMSNEQANQYLNTQLKKYQKSRSYGNFSLAQRDAINVTFELLLEKYKLPEPEDNKHLAVMFGLSKIENLSLENNQDISTLGGGISHTQEHLNSISSNVEFVKSAIEPIASYTEQKKQEARNLEDQRKNLRQQQLERAKKIKGRENSKNPKNFECSLTDDQLRLLLECCNEIKVFRHPVTKQELSDVLLCIHAQPLQTTNARLLSLLFSNLQNADYIHYEWQSIAARNVCFKSKLGNDLKTNNDFSSAAAAAGTVNVKKEKIILEYIKKIKDVQ